MATLVEPPAAAPRRKRKSIRPDMYERVLAAGSVAMLVAVVVAVARGRAEWGAVPPIVWLHLVTIVAALVLTPVLLLRTRGNRPHRRLGWAWAAAMLTAAASSLFIREINDGGWSAIHILSVITMIGVPAALFAARRHRVESHRLTIRMIVTGALLIAGFFTFPFGRMLGRWLLG